MFEKILAPANPNIVRKCRIWSGINASSQGIISIGMLFAKLKEVIPEGLIIEKFRLMALAIAFVTALPLILAPKIISVSLAELGLATSLMYLGYSMTGIFQPDYNVVIKIVLCLLAFTFLLIFSQWIQECQRNQWWSDLIVNLIVLAFFFGLWLYPILK